MVLAGGQKRRNNYVTYIYDEKYKRKVIIMTYWAVSDIHGYYSFYTQVTDSITT